MHRLVLFIALLSVSACHRPAPSSAPKPVTAANSQAPGQAEPTLGPHDGPYSRQATYVARVYADFDPSRPSASAVTVTSPDGRSRATVSLAEDSGPATISIDGALGSAKFVMKDGGPNMELLWAPDSQALFFTENDGGIVGSYRLIIIGKFGGRLVERDLTRLVSRAYGQPNKCFEPEGPNVAGLTWEGSSRRVIAIAETLPHSNCDAMGTFKAYAVDPVSGRILRTYSQIEAKAAFRGAMGPRTLGATDACFTKPTSCYIPMLHPELKLGGYAFARAYSCVPSVKTLSVGSTVSMARSPASSNAA